MRWRRDEWRITTSGIIAVAGYSALYLPAVALSGVAIATVVSIGAAPLVAGTIHALQGGHLDASWLTATASGVVGMALVVLPDATTPKNWLGVVLSVLAAATYSWQAHSISRLAHRHGTLRTVAVLFTGAATLFAPLTLVFPKVVSASPAATFGVIYLGLCTTAIAYVLFGFSVARVGAPTAVSLSLLEPVVATALAAVIASQIPNPIQWLGVGVTVAALVWLSLHRTGYGAHR